MDFGGRLWTITLFYWGCGGVRDFSRVWKNIVRFCLNEIGFGTVLACFLPFRVSRIARRVEWNFFSRGGRNFGK